MRLSISNLGPIFHRCINIAGVLHPTLFHRS